MLFINREFFSSSESYRMGYTKHMDLFLNATKEIQSGELPENLERRFAGIEKPQFRHIFRKLDFTLELVSLYLNVTILRVTICYVRSNFIL